MKTLEVGIIGNGIELVRVSNDSEKDNLKTELRAALLHSILIYAQCYSDSDISHFCMKNHLVFISHNFIDAGDLVFYVVVKTGKTGLKELLTDTNIHILADLKPKFSNLKNKYNELMGQYISSDLNRYNPLKPTIKNIFDMNKEKKKFFRW